MIKLEMVGIFRGNLIGDACFTWQFPQGATEAPLKLMNGKSNISTAFKMDYSPTKLIFNLSPGSVFYTYLVLICCVDALFTVWHVACLM